MKLYSRRSIIAGVSAVGVSSIAGCNRETFMPPTYGGVIGLSDTMTMSAQRLIMLHQPNAREYREKDISANFPTVGTVSPDDPDYQNAAANQYRDWRLVVDGLVSNPLHLSVDDLKTLPARSQITMHSCERGWSAIAQWTGVPLLHVMKLANVSPRARYAAFECVDGWYESIDMFDATHAQTILAYGMNGGELPMQHGAPVRLRVERQLGYKSVKYVQRIQFVETLANVGDGKGSTAAEYGYSWYAGI